MKVSKEIRKNIALVILALAVIGLFIYIDHINKAELRERTTLPGVYDAKDMPVGSVVAKPINVGKGLYLVTIEIGNTTKPTRYLAITESPDDFPIGSQASGKSIITTTEGNSFRDMFYIAVKPED